LIAALRRLLSSPARFSEGGAATVDVTAGCVDSSLHVITVSATPTEPSSATKREIRFHLIVVVSTWSARLQLVNEKMPMRSLLLAGLAEQAYYHLPSAVCPEHSVDASVVSRSDQC